MPKPTKVHHRIKIMIEGREHQSTLCGMGYAANMTDDWHDVTCYHCAAALASTYGIHEPKDRLLGRA